MWKIKFTGVWSTKEYLLNVNAIIVGIASLTKSGIILYAINQKLKDKIISFEFRIETQSLCFDERGESVAQ